MCIAARRLVSGGDDGAVRVWAPSGLGAEDAVSARAHQQQGQPHGVLAVAAAPPFAWSGGGDGAVC
eukprot:gene8540-4797_t